MKRVGSKLVVDHKDGVAEVKVGKKTFTLLEIPVQVTPGRYASIGLMEGSTVRDDGYVRSYSVELGENWCKATRSDYYGILK